MSFKQNGTPMKTFVESQFEVIYVYEFQKKANPDEDICWVSFWSYVILWVSNKSEVLWRDLLSFRLNLSKFTSFKQKRILLKTFDETQFEVIQLYEFQTKANSYEDISWVSVWSYVGLWFWNKSEISWRCLLSLSLKWYKFMNFISKRFFMKAFVESQFEVITVYEFQTKPNYDEDICSVSLWSYVSLCVSSKSGFLWRHFLRVSLELCKFMSFKQKRIITEPYFRSQFEVR